MKLRVTQESKYAATIEAESRTVSVVPVDDLTGGIWRPLIFYGNVTHAACSLDVLRDLNAFKKELYISFISRTLIITRVQRSPTVVFF